MPSANLYWMPIPGTMLGSQDTIVNKIYAVVVLMEWYLSGGYRKKKIEKNNKTKKRQIIAVCGKYHEGNK